MPSQVKSRSTKLCGRLAFHGCMPFGEQVALNQVLTILKFHLMETAISGISPEQARPLPRGLSRSPPRVASQAQGASSVTHNNQPLRDSLERTSMVSCPEIGQLVVVRKRLLSAIDKDLNDFRSQIQAEKNSQAKFDFGQLGLL
jgi:hypothetical protein